MDALSITQTIFYAVASLVLIVLGALLVAAALRLLGILKDARDVSKGVKSLYTVAKRATDKIFRPSKSKKE